jgi:3-oxoacyl-[acyl-carrier-protein] synthase-3
VAANSGATKTGAAKIGATKTGATATRIRATAVSVDPAVRSSIEHAAIAANECLRRAAIRPDQVGVLINTGVYRDENMAEPAMSALVQKKVGMNLDYVNDPIPNAGFSFDLMNGACGVLNAVQVAGAFLTAGSAEYALVVSSDAHPSGEAGVPGFPYATVGAAMLLERTVDTAAGFGRVHTAAGFGRVHTAASHEKDQAGVTGYMDLPAVGVHGREQIVVRRDDDYAERLLEFTAAEARRYADAEGIDLTRTLLVTSQPTPSFAADLAARLGVGTDAAVTVDSVDGDPHTSALTLAYHQAVADGRAARYPEALFVAAGAGLTVACSSYREPQG